MYQTIQDEELWELWISNPFRDGSFNAWKDSLNQDNRSKEEIELTAKEGMKNALATLNGFEEVVTDGD